MGHAKLGPSSSHRWLVCNPAPKFEEQFKDKTSVYAEEGTAAHALGEAILADDPIAIKKARASEYYSAEMEEAVQVYVEYVLEAYANAHAIDPFATMLLEKRLDFSEWVPEGFGTGDGLVIADGIIEVIDYKHGKGVSVECEGNSQLRLYGLGAYNTYKMLYDIKTVKMTIVQPRLGNISSCEMLVEDLLDWAENYVKPRAKLAWAGEGDFLPGDHCRFCKGKIKCEALAKENLKMAQLDFKEPNMLTNNQIGEILGQIDLLTNWASSVKAYALEQAENHGIKWDGWKLVEGRSNRKYSDSDAVISSLTAAGYEEEKLYEKKLLGITKMEKLVTKKKFNELVGDYIIKPPGKPTLVPLTDKRPEINSVDSAKADFV